MTSRDIRRLHHRLRAGRCDAWRICSASAGCGPSCSSASRRSTTCRAPCRSTAKACACSRPWGSPTRLLPRLNVSRNIRHVSADGKLLLLISRGGVGPEGWNNAYRFYQPELEDCPARRLETLFLRRCAACAPRPLRSTNGTISVRVRYENLASGALEEVSARYVVGCDGARSTVRRFMGAALQDLRSHERWIVLDMVLDRAARWRAGSGRRDRPCRRRDSVLRSGAADDFRSDAGQTPSLGIHADAAG